jgi:hypothetical protein
MSGSRTTRNRHGRQLRSDVRGIAAIGAGDRNTSFAEIAKDVVNYLCDVQPTLMHDIQVEMTLLPSAERADGVPRRWTALRSERRVILYRLPIERGSKLHREDDWHRRNNIETIVIEAIADLIDIDPYELAPNRYFPHA